MATGPVAGQLRLLHGPLVCDMAILGQRQGHLDGDLATGIGTEPLGTGTMEAQLGR